MPFRENSQSPLKSYVYHLKCDFLQTAHYKNYFKQLEISADSSYSSKVFKLFS